MKKPIKRSVKKIVDPIIDERVRPIIAAIEAAADLFDKESEALEVHGSLALETFFEQKKELDSKIKSATVDALGQGFALKNETPEANILEKSLERLQVAAIRNAEYLQGAKNALDHVNSLIRKSASDNGSEGMYNRLARKVDARDKTIVGFGTAV
jgi:hypothetical protein